MDRTTTLIKEKANNVGISVISFCDHNVLGAYQILDNIDLSKYRTRINLLITVGSDFHREQKQKLRYGTNGTIPITEEYCLKNYTQIENHQSSENLQAKSLKTFVEKYNTKINIRTSLSDYRKEKWLTNIPLYIIENIRNIM